MIIASLRHDHLLHNGYSQRIAAALLINAATLPSQRSALSNHVVADAKPHPQTTQRKVQ
jgi:hypothetical protein